jgi:AraC family transcriptional regulator, transcriptional activator for feuABC-ybbA operon
MNSKLNHNPNWLDLAKQANWSVAKMAALCNVSTRAIELHFLKTTDKSPKAWLIEQRQRQAVELLRGGSSVKETAAQLGYGYAHHFSREFKKYWGHCPTQVVRITTYCNSV